MVEDEIVEQIQHTEKIVHVPVERIIERPVYKQNVIEKPVYIEKIKEVQVEVPVEKIIEVPVEKIVEVPVEIIIDNPVIREKIVEQQIYVDKYTKKPKSSYNEVQADPALLKQIEQQRADIQKW